jgi:hypothetical protein
MFMIPAKPYQQKMLKPEDAGGLVPFSTSLPSCTPFSVSSKVVP